MYTGSTYNLYRYNGFDINTNSLVNGWEPNDAYVWQYEDIFSAETRFSAYTVVDDIVELNSGPIDMLYDYQQKKYCMRTFHIGRGGLVLLVMKNKLLLTGMVTQTKVMVFRIMKR